MLAAADFPAFFREVHGFSPFPWQERLAHRVAAEGRWPDTLDLPTGCGKTAAIDVAVFHLALDVARGGIRRAPVRTAFVIDRRLIVDDVRRHAETISRALLEPVGPVATQVADALKQLALDGPPLIVRSLRGGMPMEHDWARTPTQPTVICSTVDQVGSRLLFRGYGVSDTMKPIHAGLIGCDCLLLLDEVHLAEPFRQTLGWVAQYRGPAWREADIAMPWGVACLSATPTEAGNVRFQLDERDRRDPVLQRRLEAAKPARLIRPQKGSRKGGDRADSDSGTSIADASSRAQNRAASFVEQLRVAFEHFRDAASGAQRPAVGVVVNRVARAREVHRQVARAFAAEISRGDIAEPILMIGPARPVDRDRILDDLAPIRTLATAPEQTRNLPQALIVVATQCLEVGVDIDLDAVITDLAPIDALRQRFGRLNRAGRPIRPYAAIIAAAEDLSNDPDPVYGDALRGAWDYLTSQADTSEGRMPVVDFGTGAFDRRSQAAPVPIEAVSEKLDAPVLMPAHLDLLCQTCPVPAADPDLALYLHGPERPPDGVTLIWRADLEPDTLTDEDTREILSLMPPRAAESVEIPAWAVRRLLNAQPGLDVLADVAGREPVENHPAHRGRSGRRAFRWTGWDESSRWIDASEVRQGDTIVVPAAYGGCDRFGWDAEATGAVTDVASAAARPYRGRRFSVRVAPGLFESPAAAVALRDALAACPSYSWVDLREAVSSLELPVTLREELELLDTARRRKVEAYIEAYGHDDQGRPRGVIFCAPLGLEMPFDDVDVAGTTEDDVSGSLVGFEVELDVHTDDVVDMVSAFARTLNLPAALAADLSLSARLHDVGKADPRFQSWLRGDRSIDPLGQSPGPLIAKSGRSLTRAGWNGAGLPDHWRHEATSVRSALSQPSLAEASDPELVLWLIGTHHGRGRPLFPHTDPTEIPPDVGPQSLAFDWRGYDWCDLFERLKARYGVWQLAHLEALLRLADHRASQARSQKESVR